jgi:uncharacterized protein with PIN domain
MSTYTCAMCKETFEKGVSDEEAIAEMESHFGKVPIEELAVVCNDCYKLIDPATHPHEVETAIADHQRSKLG